MPAVVLHSVAGAPGTSLGRLLDGPFGHELLRPLIGALPRPVARVTGPGALLRDAAQGLPQNAATAEAVAIRLRRAGVDLTWGESDLLPDWASFVRFTHARGAASVELVRADPSLLTELQVGTFFYAYWRRRLLRRFALRFGSAWFAERAPAFARRVVADLAFWAGVRSAAAPQEWERFALSSYVVFYCHRIGSGGWPAQENMNLELRRFERLLGLLHALGFRPLAPAELLAFHRDAQATLPRRSFVLTADDALRDTVAALTDRGGDLSPVVFVNTGAVGERPWWAFGKSVADWGELGAFERAGGAVGSHCRGHPQLPSLDPSSLQDELAGSLADLRQRLPDSLPLLAYPHGLHDERVRSTARTAGYAAAFTTEPGRNGAGIDPHCLRRVELKNWDGLAATVWKAAAGELLPWRWERLRRRARRVAEERAPAESA